MQQCEELEQLQRIHDDFNLHRKIKETAGVYKKILFSNVENDQGELAQGDQQRKIIWENYISNLFAVERPAVKNVDDKDLSGPPITKEDIIERRLAQTAYLKSFRHERSISYDLSTDSELQRSEKGHNDVFHRL